MTIDRITQEIHLRVGDRFILLYGTHTSDSFCDQDLILQDIEQTLHHYLKNQGYQRIAFYSGNRKLYFLDFESRDRAIIPSPSFSCVPANDEIKVTPGPLGRKKRFLGKGKSQTTTPPGNQTQQTLNTIQSSSLSSSSRMQDRDVLPLLQKFMEDTSQRSAIVFAHPEDLRRFELQRQLDGLIVEWSRLLPTNRNLCIFIFHQDTFSKLQNFYESVGLTFLNNLLANREQSQNIVNVCNITTPTASEINNLIHFLRLKYKQPIAWTELVSLTTALAQESKPLKYWYDTLSQVKEISLEQAYIENWTQKMPLLTEEELTEALHQRIIGHRKQISELVKLVRGKIGAKMSPKPLVILLPGPTGTGKTELSKVLAETLGTKLERCDMGEYGEEHKVANLFGSPLGYAGSERGGWLPNTLRRNHQRCVLLFDEIEKAHTSIWQKMLAFFDEGRASDANGTVVTPKDTICLLTTNLASEQIAEDPARAKTILLKTGYLKPEFLGRIDKVIPLGRLELAEQAEMIFRLIKRFTQDQYGINLVVDSPALATLIPKTYEQVQNEGGRGAIAVFRDLFVDELLNLQAQNINCAELIAEEDRVKIVSSDREQPLLDFATLATGTGRRNETTLKELLRELDEMIGLASVKQAVHEFVGSEQAKLKLRKAGYEIDDHITRHMIFLGNPGTGKTTVARMVGKILKALGILKKGQFIEATRESLVAEYVGQTAPKTRKKVEEALDGILFIDEAYSLASQQGVSGHDFGQEAINTLVPILENYRDRLVVIFAGYTHEMQHLLSANPGIKSRIAKIIEFPDYTGDEMLQIFLYYCRVNKPAYICPPDVQRTVLERLNWMSENSSQNFGNGRDVRNLFESMRELQLLRLVRDNLQGDEMITFNLSDVPPLNTF